MLFRSLKGIIVEADWEDIKEQIRFTFAQDQYFEEAKEAESLRNRMDLLQTIQPYVGLYYSQRFVKRNVLRLTDDEMENIEKEIGEEPPNPMLELQQMQAMQGIAAMQQQEKEQQETNK